jgi:hypothetical protein
MADIRLSELGGSLFFVGKAKNLSRALADIAHNRTLGRIPHIREGGPNGVAHITTSPKFDKAPALTLSRTGRVPLLLIKGGLS